MYTYLAAILLFVPIALGVWCGGGRREWSLQLLTQTLLWAGILLHLLFLFRLYGEQRHPARDSKPVSWYEPLTVWAILVPWVALILLGWKGTYNPAYVPLDNTLLSPLLPLEHAERQPTTINPVRSRLYLGFHAALTVFLAGAWLTLRTRRAIRLLLALILANGALLTVLGIAAKAGGSEKMLWLIESHTRSFFATIYYKNHWGGLILLWVGIGMGLAIDAWRRSRAEERTPEFTLACLILLFPMLTSLIMAEARASALVAIPLTFLFVGGLLRFGLRSRQHLLGYCAWLAIIVSMLGALWWVAHPQATRMYERSERQLDWLVDGESIPFNARISAYRSTLSVFAERPVWGWGAGSFAYLYPLHAEEELIQPDGKPLFFEFAHNDYLQLLAEHGVVGGVLVLLPPVLALILARRYRWSHLAIWLSAGLAGLLLLAAMDFPFGNPAVTATFWLLFAAALAHRRLSTPEVRGPAGGRGVNNAA